MVGYLVVPTKNRPRQLERLINSLSSSSLRLVIADESTDDASRAVCSQSPLVYVGSRERAEYLDRLSTASHVSRELLTWGTTGLGGTRNLLQLMMAGQVYASADDDTVATFYTHGTPHRTPVRSALHDPTVFYQHATELESLPRGVPLDPLPWLLPLVDAGAAVAQVGQLGDCGMSGPMGIADRYEHARVTRLVRRHVSRPTLTRGGHLMLHYAVFDGRTALPPFYPTGRGEDAIFATCLALLGRDVGHAPLAVTHLPEDSTLRGVTPREHRPHDALWHWLCSETPGHSLATLGQAIQASGLESTLGPFGELMTAWPRIWESALECPRTGRQNA